MASGFWRSVISTLTSSAIAQLIPVLGSLILARQYAPSEFGVFSTWLGIVQFFSVVITGRLEAALAMELDGEPRRLTVITTLVTAGCVTLVLCVVLGGAVFLEFHGVSASFPLLSALTLPASLSLAVGQTWQSWAVAGGCYRHLAAMRITSAGAITILQIASGLVFKSAEALATSYLIGSVVTIFLSAKLMPVGKIKLNDLSMVVSSVWLRNRRFALFSLPADAINVAAVQLPLLLVASKFGAEVTGLLALTMRTLGAPIGLLGKSILDVFKRYAAASYRERGECRKEYIKTFNVLLAGALLLCVVVLAFGESIFVLAFGSSWRPAGTMAIWLLPIFAMRFMASPLSYMVYIAGRQSLDLLWQVALLVMTVTSLCIPERHDIALISYSVGYSLLYVVYLAMSYQFSLGRGYDSNC